MDHANARAAVEEKLATYYHMIERITVQETKLLPTDTIDWEP
jgi:hypothetical protein